MSPGFLSSSQGYENVPMYIKVKVGGWQGDIFLGIDMRYSTPPPVGRPVWIVS